MTLLGRVTGTRTRRFARLGFLSGCDEGLPERVPRLLVKFFGIDHRSNVDLRTHREFLGTFHNVVVL